jgi:hypothetical protein
VKGYFLLDFLPLIRVEKPSEIMLKQVIPINLAN